MLPDILYAFVIIINRKFFVMRRWDVVPLHKSLGKSLTSFELGCLAGGADNDYSGKVFISFEKVKNAVNKRIFRTHYHHLYGFGQTQLLDGFKIGKVERIILTCLSCACITGGNN